MAKAKGLGKGLDALMGDSTTMQSQEAGSVMLPISQVEPGLNQPRKRFDDEALADLAASIEEHGIIQPLTVRRLSTGYYQIIAGERRWRAAKLAGRDKVPVVIIEADDRKVMELGLIENLQREDLNPVEEAEGYLALLTDFGMTQEELARRMGKSRPAIANALRLTALPPSVRAMLVEGTITAGHGRAVLMVEGEQAQAAFAQKIVEEGWNVRQAESAAKRFTLEAPGDKAPKPVDQDRLYIESAQKDLSLRLGRKVTISNGRKKGRLELEYYDVDDLNDLLDQLGQLTPVERPSEGGGAG
ncbi:MAG: ParB/RepB/Spo0J family partition protein [Oscillospiraceae bacterium]|jgi:ParB family chromosome partitioning protein|nr:ParB/RepB/Spo0J family partition protein [Oscillospiraceae bacterium]MCI9549829.1 ParB/RepB/Spo0J family partition protein [Oscillospiraceae bacterium]